MRIGLIAPPWVSVPPRGYGGTEAVIDLLARGLRDHGHDVLLFTIGSSTCPVARGHLYDRAATPFGNGLYEAAHVLAAYDELTGAEADVIHDHTTLGPLVPPPTGRRAPVRVVTQHGPFLPESRRILNGAATPVSVIAISHDHASRAGGVPIAAVIPHAVDLDTYRPASAAALASRPEPYVAFVGRMSATKGVHRAVRIARRAGLPLRIVAKMREREERDYFESQVRPLLRPGDPLPEELEMADRISIVQGAVALLDPIDWPEPFGLVMAESLAMGTPVVAFRSGAAPEIVDDGVTGFLVRDETEAVRALRRVSQLDRGRCRAAAERLFSVDRFVGDHERLYRSLLEPTARPMMSAGAT